MYILLKILYKEVGSNSVWISEMNAIKDDIVVKKKVLKDYILTEDIEKSIVNIKDSMSKTKLELRIECSNMSLKDSFIDTFGVEDIQELSSDMENDYRDSIEEMIVYINENVVDVPSFVTYIPEDEFSINLNLFRIANYFNDNQQKIYDFPMFLKMKKDKKIEEFILVEEFIEDILEKTVIVFGRD